MPKIDAAHMLLDEMKDHGRILADLIALNELRQMEFPADKEYYQGKVTAYEVAYDDFLRRLKKVNSYF